MRHPFLTTGLTAAAGLLGRDWDLEISRSGWMRLSQSTPSADPEDGPPSDIYILPLHTGSATDGASVVREARNRVRSARMEDELPSDCDAIVLVSGVVGSLGVEEIYIPRNADISMLIAAVEGTLNGLPGDLITPAAGDHLIDGPDSGRCIFINASGVGETCT